VPVKGVPNHQLKMKLIPIITSLLDRGFDGVDGVLCSDDKELSSFGFTDAESERAAALAAPFNAACCDDTENSMSMCAKWWTSEDGFIFAVADDFTGSTIETVREEDLEEYLGKTVKVVVGKSPLTYPVNSISEEI